MDIAARGLMKASHGAAAPATKHVYLCQSLLGQRLEGDREAFASHVCHPFDVDQIKFFSNILFLFLFNIFHIYLSVIYVFL